MSHHASVEPSPSRLPRWRGFNLLNRYAHNQGHGRNRAFDERDFEWIAEWGFDFVRLPLSYLTWSRPDDPRFIDESVMADIDEAVEFGRRHGIHVNVCLHRLPGYCINPPAEPLDLWKDDAALELARHHWSHLARRYRGIANSRVSFDLINEPDGVTATAYARVVRSLVEAIHAEDPGRLVIADGIDVGNTPVPELAGVVAQSARGYGPMHVSHWKASWVRGSDAWAEPTWPLTDHQGTYWDKGVLRERFIEPWQRLASLGVGVHVGEFGAHRQTPHPVVLAWLGDWLTLWREAGWGWALWEFRGTFGILDSRRDDVAYENYKGHQLDRALLDLLRAH